MPGVLTLLQVLVKLAGTVAAFARDRQLMQAGEAKFIVRQMEETNALLSEVRSARRSANDGGVMRDDGFQRRKGDDK